MIERVSGLASSPAIAIVGAGAALANPGVAAAILLLLAAALLRNGISGLTSSRSGSLLDRGRAAPPPRLRAGAPGTPGRKSKHPNGGPHRALD
jgi:hypothetical protein